MNPAIRLLMFIVTLALCQAAAASDNAAGVSAKDRAAITELLHSRDTTLSAGDVNAFLDLTTDDYIEMPSGAPTLNKEGARKALAEFLGENQFSLRSEIRDLSVAGNWAYVRMESDQKVTPKSGEAPVHINGKSLMIMHH